MRFRLSNRIPFHLLQDLELDTHFDIEVDIPLSYYPYTISSYAASILGKRGVNKESKLEYLIEHLKEDVSTVENSIIKLQNSKDYQNFSRSSYDPLETARTQNEFELSDKIKEKIGLISNSTFRYERVKRSKKCKASHNHQYFYAYYTDRLTKKLKKKYIGKHLPLPIHVTLCNIEKGSNRSRESVFDKDTQ